MKSLVVVVCLVIAGVLPPVASAQPQQAAEPASPFTEARRIGEPAELAFFLFSASGGEYVIRHDGMGEVATPAHWRKVFYIKVGAGVRIQRLYFLERKGDLLLLFEASGTGYLVRMNQQTRKIKLVTTLSHDFAPPALKAEQLVFSDGTTVSLT